MEIVKVVDRFHLANCLLSEVEDKALEAVDVYKIRFGILNE